MTDLLPIASRQVFEPRAVEIRNRLKTQVKLLLFFRVTTPPDGKVLEYRYFCKVHQEGK